MSNLVDKSVRIIQFSRKKKDWRVWMGRFLAAAGKKKYKKLLLGIEKAPPDSETLDKATQSGKQKYFLRQANEEAYHDLVLANDDEIAFNIIDTSVSTSHPDGDAALAWKKLNAKYESTTNASMKRIQGEFFASKLNDMDKDPVEWTTELEVLQSRLKNTKFEISDEQLLNHVLLNLPNQYDGIIDSIEISDKDFKLDEVNDLLTEKFEKIRLKSENEDTSSIIEEKALIMTESNENQDDKIYKSVEKCIREMMKNQKTDTLSYNRSNPNKQFKGRCRVCGRIGHKGTDCWENPNNSNKRPNGWKSSFLKGEMKFLGNCYFCGEQGHKISDCPKRENKFQNKTDQEEYEDVAFLANRWDTGFFMIDDEISYLEQSVDESEKNYGGEFLSTKYEKFLNTKSNEYIVTENKDSRLMLSMNVVHEKDKKTKTKTKKCEL